MTENWDKLLEMCKGNAAAARFCHVFVSHCHCIDDIVDGDKEADAERIIHNMVALLLEMNQNPFYVKNSNYLLPLILHGYNSWLDSNDWEMSKKDHEVIAADVLKGYYHEVVFGVIYLCGGWEHLRNVTSEHRSYDFELEKGE